MNKKTIAISLLLCNEYELIRPCLESLLASDLNLHNYKLFLWDNNSKDQSVEWIKTLDIPQTIIQSNTNEGIVIPRIKLFNTIQQEGGYDYLLEIHADMLFPDKWVEPLLKIDTPDTLILQPHILQRQRNISVEEFKSAINIPQEEKIYNKCRQVHPWLIKLNLVDKVGGYYDDLFSPQRCEDDDFVYRVITNGYLIRSTNQSVVFHYGGKTRGKVLGNAGHDHKEKFSKKHNIQFEDFLKLFEYHPSIWI